MTAIPGPQGTGDKFLRAVAKWIAKGYTELQARRKASQSNKNYKR